MLYELIFDYWDEDDPNKDDTIFIAVYSSYELAERGRKKFAKQPRFKGKEEAFEIREYEVNDKGWPEGFRQGLYEYFFAQLTDDLIMKKIDDNDVRIKLDDGTNKYYIFEGEVEFYAVSGRIILLKSEKTGKFYCIDPDHKTKKIRIETKDKEEFSAYLKQNYGMDSCAWTEIVQYVLKKDLPGWC